MNYTELNLPCADPVQSEIWMAELAEFPFESFAQEDTSLKAYIRESDLATCRPEVEAFLRTTGVRWEFRTIEQQNWNSLWESSFDPVEVGGRCVIRAPFHAAPEAGRLDLVIMPKMSFGTGHHATTWLMVDAMLRRELTDLEGLDMGSGTGVLAIAAVKLGARCMDAVDIEESALENCAENVAVNGVAESVRPILGDVLAIKGREYDFILANINRNILLADMSAYLETLRPGGFIIMSGILEQDVPAITEAATSFGLSPVGTNVREGWAAVSFERRNN